MDLQVILEITHMIKSLSTLRTLTCFFSRVCDLMGGEMGVCLETLPTSSAQIWLFPSMDPLVCLEMTYLAKGLSTLRTLIRLSPFIRDLMGC